MPLDAVVVENFPVEIVLKIQTGIVKADWFSPFTGSVYCVLCSEKSTRGAIPLEQRTPQGGKIVDYAHPSCYKAVKFGQR